MLNKCISHSQIKCINEIIIIRVDERVDRVNPTQSAAIINKGKDIIYERATTMKKWIMNLLKVLYTVMIVF